MAKTRSFGAKVYVNGIAVGGLTDISASGTDVAFVETTSHDSAGGYRTFLSGLKDGGTLELTGRYNYADIGQDYLKDNPGASAAFVVTFSDGTKASFSAIVGGYSVANPLDDATEFSCSCKITGAITWAAS